MITNKHFNLIAIIVIALAAVFVCVMSFCWVNSEAESGPVSYSVNDISKCTAKITLNGTEAKVSGSGVTVEDGVVKILYAGTYHISGDYQGQVYVEVEDTDSVTLVLEGANITNTDGPAIYVANSGSCLLYLAEGTENALISGEEKMISKYFIDESATGGCLTFKDDATIAGTGSLTVNGYINNGIHCSNNLFIEDGTISIASINNGIKGGDSLTIDGGDIAIETGNAGLKSGDSSDDSGEVTINNGTLVITASYEGIEANQIIMNDGDVSITASDDGINANGGSSSFGEIFSRGMGGFVSKDQLKSGGDDTDSTDKKNSSSKKDKTDKNSGSTDETQGSTASGGAIEMPNGGSFEIPSGGAMEIPSGSAMEIPSGGAIDISGITSEGGIQLPNGDNLTIPGETDGSTAVSAEVDDSLPNFIMNGGSLYIDAQGDGLDSNGNLIINGGVVVVDGPNSSSNGALDSGSENGGSLLVNGGTLIAVGATGMAETPEEDSAQCAFNLTQSFTPNQTIVITDSNGNELFSHTTIRSGGSIIFSSPELTIGETYTVTVGSKTYTISQDSQIAGDQSSGMGNMMNINGGGQINIQTPNISTEGGIQTPDGTTEGGIQMPDGTSEGGIQMPGDNTQGDNIQLPDNTNGGGMQMPNGGGQGGNIQMPDNTNGGGMQMPNGGGQDGNQGGGMQMPNGGGNQTNSQGGASFPNGSSQGSGISLNSSGNNM